MALKLIVNSLKLAQKPIASASAPICNQTINKITPIILNTPTRQAHFFAAENVAAVPEVYLDKGKFKYLRIKVLHKEITGYKECMGCKTIVRGYKEAKYHGDILKATEDELSEYNLQAAHAGGGYMNVDIKKRKIHIYGSSQKYGRADHAEVAKLLRARFPCYEVTYDKPQIILQ